MLQGGPDGVESIAQEAGHCTQSSTQSKKPWAPRRAVLTARRRARLAQEAMMSNLIRASILTSSLANSCGQLAWVLSSRERTIPGAKRARRNRRYTVVGFTPRSRAVAYTSPACDCSTSIVR